MIKILRFHRHNSKLSIAILFLKKKYYIKLNPIIKESKKDFYGYNILKHYFKLPKRIIFFKLSFITISVYEYWGATDHNEGLLVDIISGDNKEKIQDFMNEMTKQLNSVFLKTYKVVPSLQVEKKLFYNRVLKKNSRLKYFYKMSKNDTFINLEQQEFIINNVKYKLEFLKIIDYLIYYYSSTQFVDSVISQGDLTDVNIGIPFTFFDYDTAGRNSLFGEFSTFLIYTAYFGGYLIPKYKESIFKYHTNVIDKLKVCSPQITYYKTSENVVIIKEKNSISVNRKLVIKKFINNTIKPLCANLEIDNIEGKLNPYILIRLLTIFNIFKLEQKDTLFLISKLIEFNKSNFKLESLYL